MAYDVLINGYVSMDHILKIETPARVGFTSIISNADNIKTNYGGCGPNIAVSLCKLGKAAMPIMRVGPDWEDNGFKDYLIKNNVSLEGTKVLENETTSTCYLIQDTNGNHITCFYPGSMDGKYAERADEKLFDGTRLGVITVGSRKDNKCFYEQCREHDVPIVFGMRVDFDAFPEPFMKELLENSNIIFANEAERDVICEINGGKSIPELLKNWKACVVVITLGEKGSLCYEHKGDEIIEHYIPICPVEKVVDATGAGDAYMAGFIYGWLNGEKVEKCCRLGAALSSFILQCVGCTTNVPTPEVLEAKAEEIRTK
ncbi:MAG: PfkB family carbohydrate kinase [Lachnospiraceae bacterium]|nr:PfkB family carbohydrate kinase [Lachnospiraceae bacterium]